MKWFNAEDIFPDPDIHDNVNHSIDDVLIIYKEICGHCGMHESRKDYGIGYYDGDSWTLSQPLSEDIIPENVSDMIKVTHWMPLPKMPKGIKK